MSRKITRTFSVGVGWKGVKPSGTSKTRRRKPPSKVKRDAERMQSFIQQKQLQQEVPFVRGETLRPATTAFVRSPAGTLVRLIPRRPPPSGAGLTGGDTDTQEVDASSEPVEGGEKGQGTARKSNTGSGWYSAVPPIIRMTRQSLTYATQRLRHRGLFQLVRDYLAYFEATKDGEVIAGESRLSSEIKIKSEGMPIGEDLRKIYFEFTTGMGATQEDVTRDLERVRTYLASTRITWLQALRETDRRYMMPWPPNTYK